MNCHKGITEYRETSPKLYDGNGDPVDGCQGELVRVPQAENGFVNSEIAYNNLMHKCQWRGQNDPNVYHDETCRGERLVASGCWGAV